MRTTMLTTCWALACACGAQQVTVTPEETDELLANPGMGWETFHWTSEKDKNQQDWIPSTVQYVRWGWKDLEIAHPAQAGGTLDAAMKWQNVGSAPCYRPYRIAYRLTNGKAVSVVIVGRC